MAPTKSYSSLFTAGIFSFGSRAGSTTRSIPSPIFTGDVVPATPTPTISVRPPPSPSRKTDPSPRRRRKSSVTLGSSPMAAIKSPVQRVQYSHRSAIRAQMGPPPGRVLEFLPLDGVPTVQENQILTRPRRGRMPPPKQKPAPTDPLPNPPLPSFCESLNLGPTRLSLPRRDSDTLPLPSPSLSFFDCRTPSPAPPQTSSGLLAPSPMIGSFSHQQSGSIPEEMEDQQNQ
ncbi:hypothetical protein FRB96_002107 [Tulasnella sp. 330]|nr:hypothetical protein FRB96_002107 [Tulasnella sp. 330]KAG8876128.1 hypothetical protein FRB97_004429 [Tulasnella sp. 331]KAG8881959.1 hypothetical protein FRB98_004037 [Tulasnella sp. 332]